MGGGSTRERPLITVPAGTKTVFGKKVRLPRRRYTQIVREKKGGPARVASS